MSKQQHFKNHPVCVLRVNIHCDGCEKKIKKALKKIEGVEAASIDAEQGKVTVSGYVHPNTIIKKLEKSGKQAELWGPTMKSFGHNNFRKNQVSDIDDQFGDFDGGMKKMKTQQKGGKGFTDMSVNLAPIKVPKSVKFEFGDSGGDESDGFDVDFGRRQPPRTPGRGVVVKKVKKAGIFRVLLRRLLGKSKGKGGKGGKKALATTSGGGHGGGKGRSGKQGGGKNGDWMMESGKNGGKNMNMAVAKKGGKKGKNLDFEIDVGNPKKGARGGGGGGKGGGGSYGGYSQGGGGYYDGQGRANSGGNMYGEGGHGGDSAINGGSYGGGRFAGQTGQMGNPQMMGNHQMGHHSTGQMGNHQMGHHQMGHQSIGQMGHHQMGHQSIGQMGNHQMGPTSTHQMGHHSTGQMGHYSMGQMGHPNYSAVSGPHAPPMMNGGGGGYYQGMVARSNPYNQQYMAMMMNQQRMQGNEMYHPLMSDRRPNPMGSYDPPRPSGGYTHMFSDENTESCSIM